MDDETATGTTQQTDPGSPASPAPRSKRKWLLGGLTLIFMLCGSAYGAYWAFIGRFAESTDDAYVAGNVVPLTPRVNGTVIAIHADNTQRVTQGQAVVLLDNTDARIALDQAEARLAQTVREVQGLYQTVAQQEANVSLQQARLAQSKIDYRRNSNLVIQKFVSAEDFQHSGTQVDIDQAGLDLAEHQLAATRAAVAQTDLADHPEVRLAAANLRDAFVALQRTTIRAPVTGYVDKRSVQVGERVSPGMPLMAIIPLDQIWVEANFKESQLRNVRIGQPVSLTSDVYSGHVVYRGRVLGFGAGTGSAFAVLPPQNATGNWIKVVQRVPVRVGLDPVQIARYPLRVGLSMEAVVDTHDRTGSARGDDPEPQAGYVTRVFQDEDRGAGALISRILQDNTVTALPAQVTGVTVTGTAHASQTRRIHDDNPAATARMTAGLPLRRQVDGLSHE
jgi:membrane fusion protein (multidrug efflux system)